VEKMLKKIMIFAWGFRQKGVPLQVQTRYQNSKQYK